MSYRELMETWRDDPVNRVCYRFRFCPNARSNGWHRCSGYCAVRYGRSAMEGRAEMTDYRILPKVRHSYYRLVLLCLKLFGDRAEPVVEEVSGDGLEFDAGGEIDGEMGGGQMGGLMGSNEGEWGNFSAF